MEDYNKNPRPQDTSQWKSLSIIFIVLFLLVSATSAFYITNLIKGKNNAVSQNSLLQQQLAAIKQIKEAKDIPRVRFQLLSQQLSQLNTTNNELRKELMACKKHIKK